jgi:hypothetical protein
MLARSYLRSMRAVGAARNAGVNTSKVRSTTTSTDRIRNGGEQSWNGWEEGVSLNADDLICSVPLQTQARQPQMPPPLSH